MPSQFKTTLFELENELIELKLPSGDEDDASAASMNRNKKSVASTKMADLHGKWLVVNGNFIKPDPKQTNLEQSSVCITLFFC